MAYTVVGHCLNSFAAAIFVRNFAGYLGEYPRLELPVGSHLAILRESSSNPGAFRLSKRFSQGDSKPLNCDNCSAREW